MRDVKIAGLDGSSSLHVGGWVSVGADCPMRYRLSGSGQAIIIFGRGPDEFEFALEAGALCELVRLGVDALDEMGCLTGVEPSELVTVGERPA